jgi:3-hydroxyacyl-[acyl-carrier-protein] dehydratase
VSILTRSQIEALIPHRDPFLWIDEVLELSPERIVAQTHVKPELDLFRGHYPGNPILPGVILCEAAMQAGALLIARFSSGLRPGEVPVATRINNVKFRQIVRPGDKLLIEVDLTEQLANAFFLKARLSVDGKTTASLEFACATTTVEH